MENEQADKTNGQAEDQQAGNSVGDKPFVGQAQEELEIRGHGAHDESGGRQTELAKGHGSGWMSDRQGHTRAAVSFRRIAKK